MLTAGNDILGEMETKGKRYSTGNSSKVILHRKDQVMETEGRLTPESTGNE